MATLDISDWSLSLADRFDPPQDPYVDDPVGFGRDILGFHAWSKQRAILEALRDHDRVAVRSCHGVGKTAGAAEAVLWFLKTRKNSRVITTAPTWAQVEQLLWREIRGRVAAAKNAGHADVFPPVNKTRLEIAEQWFAIGLSTNEPERFQGHHADHLLLVVDEASGVDESIFEAAEGFLTAEGAKVLLIGNPTQIGGQFYRAFHSERARWHTIHISVHDSPNYTGEQVPEAVRRAMPRDTWAEEMRAAWGEDSTPYQVRVLGNFPTSSDDNVIPLAWVDAAQARWKALAADDWADLPPLKIVGLDVAYTGNDKTVAALRHGQIVRELQVLPKLGTMDTAGRLDQLLKRAEDHPKLRPTAVIDVLNIGAGVVDRARELGHLVVAFNAGEATDRKDRSGQLGFINKRAAAWWNLREMLDPDSDFEVALPPDDYLTGDLTAPKWRMTSGGRVQIESKDEIRKRLGHSTDHGDSVVQAFWPETAPDLSNFTGNPEASFFARRPSGSRWRVT